MKKKWFKFDFQNRMKIIIWLWIQALHSHNHVSSYDTSTGGSKKQT